jgi:hypothetical protein
MDRLTIFEPYQAGLDIYIVPSYFPISQMRFLAINAFVSKAKEPVMGFRGT